MSRAATLCGVLCLGVPAVLIALVLAASPDESGIWSRLLLEVQSAQRSLQRELAATLQAAQQRGRGLAVKAQGAQRADVAGQAALDRAQARRPREDHQVAGQPAHR